MNQAKARLFVAGEGELAAESAGCLSRELGSLRSDTALLGNRVTTKPGPSGWRFQTNSHPPPPLHESRPAPHGLPGGPRRAACAPHSDPARQRLLPICPAHSPGFKNVPLERAEAVGVIPLLLLARKSASASPLQKTRHHPAPGLQPLSPPRRTYRCLYRPR